MNLSDWYTTRWMWEDFHWTVTVTVSENLSCSTCTFLRIVAVACKFWCSLNSSQFCVFMTDILFNIPIWQTTLTLNLPHFCVFKDRKPAWEDNFKKKFMGFCCPVGWMLSRLNPLLPAYQIYIHLSPYYRFLWLSTLFFVQTFFDFGH